MEPTPKKKMASGIAKAVREIYPEAYQAYMAAENLGVGDVIWAYSKGRFIANAITQKFYGRDPSVQYVSYEGVREAMRTINAAVGGLEGDKRLCLPMIGAGLGNGQWPILEAIIEEECVDTQPVVYRL